MTSVEIIKCNSDENLNIKWLLLLLGKSRMPLVLVMQLLSKKDKLVIVKQAVLEINAANKCTVNRCKCRGNAAIHSALVLDQVSCVPIIVIAEGVVKTATHLINNFIEIIKVLK